ncbi:unnamed protein product [Choristocarpus tenellus]
MTTGERGSAEECFSGKDTSCDEGSILRDISLSTSGQEVATSLLIAGAWLGCLIASKPSETMGRRTTLLVNNVLFIVGGLLSISNWAWVLCLGRFTCGLAVGYVRIRVTCAFHADALYVDKVVIILPLMRYGHK